MALEAAPDFGSYDDVPVYRRRWLVLLFMLFLTPVGIVLALTGEIYALQHGEVMKFPASSRMLMSLGFGALLATNLIRLLQ
jgi:hypothetical protein